MRQLSLDGTAAKETKIFGLTGWLVDRYEAVYLDSLEPVWAARRRIYLWPYLGYTVVGSLIASLILVLLADGASSGDVSLTGLALGLQATVSALLLGEHYPEADVPTQFGMRAVSGLADVEAAMARVESSTGTSLSAEALGAAGGLPRESIRFEGVSFAYPGSERAVLDGLDLEIPAGGSLAIVGLNGAGKTTLIKLLARLYEPTAGRITVDGIDVARARPRELAQPGRGDLPGLRALRAARRPTTSRSGRVRTSATSRRSVARRSGPARSRLIDALPAGPRDAAVGALRRRRRRLGRAVAAHRALAGAVRARRRGRRCSCSTSRPRTSTCAPRRSSSTASSRSPAASTTILISHRFSTVRRADRIVVLDGGAIVEEGDARRARRARRPLRGALPAAGRALRARRDDEGRAVRRWLELRPLPRRRLAADRPAAARTCSSALVLVTGALGAAVRARDEGVRQRRGRRRTRRGRWCSARSSACSGSRASRSATSSGPSPSSSATSTSLAFDAELIELGGGSAGLEHLENPEYANRLELARSERRRPVPRDAVPREPRRPRAAAARDDGPARDRAARAPAAAAVRDPGDDRRPLGAAARRRAPRSAADDARG